MDKIITIIQTVASCWIILNTIFQISDLDDDVGKAIVILFTLFSLIAIWL